MCPVHSRKEDGADVDDGVGRRDEHGDAEGHAGNEAEHGEHKNERRRWHEEHEEYGGNDGDDGAMAGGLAD